MQTPSNMLQESRTAPSPAHPTPTSPPCPTQIRNASGFCEAPCSLLPRGGLGRPTRSAAAQTGQPGGLESLWGSRRQPAQPNGSHGPAPTDSGLGLGRPGPHSLPTGGPAAVRSRDRMSGGGGGGAATYQHSRNFLSVLGRSWLRRRRNQRSTCRVLSPPFLERASMSACRGGGVGKEGGIEGQRPHTLGQPDTAGSPLLWVWHLHRPPTADPETEPQNTSRMRPEDAQHQQEVDSACAQEAGTASR